MFGFVKIAGGAPSSVSDLTRHLRTNTLSPDMAEMAAYYRRGMVVDHLTEVAREVAADRMQFSEGLDELLSSYLRNGSDVDRIDDVEERLTKRLADKVSRIVEGVDLAPLGDLRPDLHPIVAKGLKIDVDRDLRPEEIDALIAGRAADGGKIEGKVYAKEREMPADEKTGERKWSQPLGSFDFTPSPDKSVSVAWALADPVEQAQIYNAHIEAARETMAELVAPRIGQARTGQGGMGEPEPGHIGWLEFTHHTSRRTMVSVGDDGIAKVADSKGLVGDPAVHTHFLVPNAVFCDTGRVGSLDTAALRGFIFEADAYYQARLGQKLREAGFEVELDERTGAARMPAISDDLRTQFSKRSVAGEMMARQYTELARRELG